jgi:hypothetical protein
MPRHATPSPSNSKSSLCGKEFLSVTGKRPSRSEEVCGVTCPRTWTSFGVPNGGASSVRPSAGVNSAFMSTARRGLTKKCKPQAAIKGGSRSSKVLKCQ